MLLYLFLLCWKLTDLLETLANLAVSFTVLFYCKALHFSRTQSQISQQKKELHEHVILFVSRNNFGFSSVSDPLEKNLTCMIKHFLQQILLINGILLLASYDIFCTTGINFKKKRNQSYPVKQIPQFL